MPYPASVAPYPASAAPYPIAVAMPPKKSSALTIVFGVLMAVFFLGAAGAGVAYYSDHTSSQNKISDQQKQIVDLQKQADDANSQLSSTKKDLTNAQSDLKTAQDGMKACSAALQAFLDAIVQTAQTGTPPSAAQESALEKAMYSACNVSL
jgi:peptidoglycan hydrolase CwlO-like protein